MVQKVLSCLLVCDRDQKYKNDIRLQVGKISYKALILTHHILLLLEQTLGHSLRGHRNYHHVELKDSTTLSNVVEKNNNLRIKATRSLHMTCDHLICLTMMAHSRKWVNKLNRIYTYICPSRLSFSNMGISFML